MLRFDFVTLFPENVLGAIRHSVLARAETNQLVSFGAVNPRDFATDAHRTVDDAPFGGNPGMVLKVDVISKAIDSVWTNASRVVTFEPWGTRFTQPMAIQLAQQGHLILVCGHYEGLDGRIATKYQSLQLSLGDFVLTGGEFPALTVADAVTRLLPGVLGDSASLSADSHANGLLSGPQFTRPWEFEGMTPPEELRSGNHRRIEQLQRKQSLLRTRELRPDLFCCANLTPEDLALLNDNHEST